MITRNNAGHFLFVAVGSLVIAGVFFAALCGRKHKPSPVPVTVTPVATIAVTPPPVYGPVAPTATTITIQPPIMPVAGNGGLLGSCHVQGALPDMTLRCTPGSVLPVTAAQVCKRGYASSVRNVSESEKRQVFREYGILLHGPGQFEVDHLISLELGGSNDIRNLWPEAAQPYPGFHEKDRFENYLHLQVCTGKLSLADAQREIATDWLSNWKAVGRP